MTDTESPEMKMGGDAPDPLMHEVPYGTCRHAVAIFAEAMEAKLKTKDKQLGKQGWLTSSTCSVAFLLGRMKDELDEAFKAHMDCKPRDLAQECVDVANFAMMIFDKLGGGE